MRRMLELFVLLAACCGLAFGQTALIEVPLVVTDGTNSGTLYFGLDPAATDGIDASVGEAERPPLPPSGAFDVRFVGSDIGRSLGNGLLKDCRAGDVNTSGDRLHEIQYQCATGASITISWTLPSWATGRLQDVVLGTLIDVSMSGTGSYTVTNPSVFSKLKMTITYTAPLPVQLVSFTATPVGEGSVRLDWATKSETNNLGFNIQRRSAAEKPFVTVSGAMIPGHGTTLVPQQYSYTDNVGVEGEYEYRLQQVDLDGTMHYPMPVKVDLSKSLPTEEKPAEYILFPNFPNPFNPSTVIRYGLPQKACVQLVVFNSLGQQVASLVAEEQEAGFHQVRFEAAGLSSGTYFCRITAGEFAQTRALILVK